jgi:hypothetical protein
LDPSGLLDAWAESFSFQSANRPKTYVGTAVSPRSLLDEAAAALRNAQLRHAACEQTAAWLLAPYAELHRIAFYVVGDHGPLIADLGLQPTETRGDLLIAAPYDEGVFDGLQERSDVLVVSPIQAYVDLFNIPGRSRDIGRFLRERLIGF